MGKSVNEIRAALFVCSGSLPDSCANCPYREDGDDCQEIMMLDAYECIKLLERRLYE